jgi:hypothetical protein
MTITIADIWRRVREASAAYEYACWHDKQNCVKTHCEFVVWYDAYRKARVGYDPLFCVLCRDDLSVLEKACE